MSPIERVARFAGIAFDPDPDPNAPFTDTCIRCGSRFGDPGVEICCDMGICAKSGKHRNGTCARCCNHSATLPPPTFTTLADWEPVWAELKRRRLVKAFIDILLEVMGCGLLVSVDEAAECILTATAEQRTKALCNLLDRIEGGTTNDPA